MKRLISAVIILAILSALAFALNLGNIRSSVMNEIDACLTPTKNQTAKQNIQSPAESEEIACKLTSAEQRKRQAELNKQLMAMVIERKEVANGFAYKFSGEKTKLSDLASLIDNERECCPFMAFKLNLEPNSKDIWLEITGAEGTKEMLNGFLGG